MTANKNEQKAIDHEAAKGEAAEDARMGKRRMRHKTIVISWEFFRGLFTPGWHESPSYSVDENAIPTDAEIVHAEHDGLGRLRLTISSAAFDEVAEGERPPELTPTMTAYFEGADDEGNDDE